MLKEFKAFAIQGNLVDTAVAFVMGAAFGKITTAFIDGIVMPLVSTLIQVDFKSWKIVLKQATMGADGKQIPAIEMTFGDFISAFINFLIVAFVMFMVIKAIASAKKAANSEEAAAAPPPPPAQEVLLAEIRDLLKSSR